MCPSGHVYPRTIVSVNEHDYNPIVLVHFKADIITILWNVILSGHNMAAKYFHLA